MLRRINFLYDHLADFPRRNIEGMSEETDDQKIEGDDLDNVFQEEEEEKEDDGSKEDESRATDREVSACRSGRMNGP